LDAFGWPAACDRNATSDPANFVGQACGANFGRQQASATHYRRYRHCNDGPPKICEHLHPRMIETRFQL
jgi:hypothetical protein